MQNQQTRELISARNKQHEDNKKDLSCLWLLLPGVCVNTRDINSTRGTELRGHARVNSLVCWFFLLELVQDSQDLYLSCEYFCWFLKDCHPPYLCWVCQNSPHEETLPPLPSKWTRRLVKGVMFGQLHWEENMEGRLKTFQNSATDHTRFQARSKDQEI